MLLKRHVADALRVGSVPFKQGACWVVSFLTTSAPVRFHSCNSSMGLLPITTMQGVLRILCGVLSTFRFRFTFLPATDLLLHGAPYRVIRRARVDVTQQ